MQVEKNYNGNLKSSQELHNQIKKDQEFREKEI